MDITTKYILFGLAVAGAFLFFHLFIAPAIARNEMKREYQSEAEPKMMWQSGENDDEFWAKVRRETARYNASGNRWAIKQNPVIPYPYNTNFSFEWFGKTENLSTVGLGQREYMAAALRTYDRLLSIWQKETGNEFGVDATMKARGQKEWDGNLWNEPGFRQHNGN